MPCPSVVQNYFGPSKWFWTNTPWFGRVQIILVRSKSFQTRFKLDFSGLISIIWTYAKWFEPNHNDWTRPKWLVLNQNDLDGPKLFWIHRRKRHKAFCSIFSPDCNSRTLCLTVMSVRRSTAATNKGTSVWSQDFIIWKFNSGLWAVDWARLWNKRVWADYKQLLKPVFSLFWD